MKLYRFFLITLLFLFTGIASSQEALKSIEEEYYDFLSLDGTTEKPAFNYRSLSDSVWNFNDSSENSSNVWADNKLNTTFTLFTPETPKNNFFLNGINQNIKLRIYGPEWFNSFNTKAPFGAYDGALWQGRGYNTSLTTGFRLEAYGLELTLKPQISFSQNLDYEILPYDDFNGKKPKYVNLNEYSYIWGPCDAPQRFGDEPFFTFDWGDSEIRYTWNNLTVGFGTQAVWLGPAVVNPLLLSNNAPTYPKFDIGLRKTEIILPFLNWDIGSIEGRFWLGYLTESDYFDDDPSDDHNQYTCFSVSYAPSFIPGLTLGANKVCLAKWNQNFWRYVNPFYDDNEQVAADGEDMKASITADWLAPSIGFELYAEVGIDDGVPENGIKQLYGYLRYPFHTMTFTTGFKKRFDISKEKELYGLVNFEYNTTEMSQDMQLMWPYNFGFHHQILQGYTNRGQWLGSGIGYGGNSQYLSFSLYSKHFVNKFFIARNNIDNNYVYSKAVYDTAATSSLVDPYDDEYAFIDAEENGLVSKQWLRKRYFTAFKANFYTGIEGSWFITKSAILNYGFAYDLIINPLYEPGLHEWSGFYRFFTYCTNFSFKLGFKYNF